MNYRIVNIRTTAKSDPERSILIIYTGGTIGMIHNEKGVLAPFNFGKVIERIPELGQLELRLTVISFPKPVDSSNINYKDWQDLAYIIYENYDQYDGFVILHGTDTMAYTASALSFMLEGLNKPVILTGAQIPIGYIRSDARENLITALEMASARTSDGKPRVREVCIYFNFLLLRGNRAQKVRSSTFAAFETQNYPLLAESGIFIEYNDAGLLPFQNSELTIKNKFDPNVIILKIYPSIPKTVIESVFQIEGLKGVVLESYGSGNTMQHKWFHQILHKAIENGIVVYNVSQCSGGEVIQGRYETSQKLNDLGVISGGDITTEAAVTKLMFLLGNESSPEIIKEKLAVPLSGEMDTLQSVN